TAVARAIFTAYCSEVLVVGTGTAFRRHPVDDLVGILDVAGLAVHAVGGVDLQALAGRVLDDLVDAGRAEAGAGVAVFLGAAGDADVGVGHLQVHRLVLVVLGGGEVDAGQAVARRQRALDVVAPDLLGLGQLLQRVPVRLAAPGPGRETGGNGFPGRVEQAEPQALLEAGLDVADLLQLAHGGAGAQPGVEAGRRGRFLSGQVFGGEHAAADGLVGTLDLGHVEQAGGVADQQGAGHFHLGHALPAAGDDGAGAGAEDAAALEQRLHRRVVLPLLEGLVGLVVRVAVVQARDVADGNAVAVQVVEEAAAVGLAVGRPAHAVDD